jgi:putative selenium metabolism protein SsnA
MLIRNARLITWGSPNEILEEHALLVRDGRIALIGPSEELAAGHSDEEVVDARGQVVMPGNINTHGHFYSALVRGMVVPGEQPFSLPTILQKLWWPFDKALREEEIRASTLVMLVDAIRHGTTTVFDHHSSPNCIDGILDVIAEEVERAGIRAVLCFEVTDRDGPDRARRGIEENVRFIRRCRESRPGGGRIGATFGIHAPMTASETTLATIREAAPDDAGFHLHVAEHEYDEYRSIEMAGVRSVDRLHRHDLLNERTIAAHAVHLDAQEIELLAASGASVSHQPRNNMNAADGIADVESYLRAGVPVCIGNDGLSYTMWKEWEFAYVAQKIRNRDARRLPGGRLIQMGAYNGAELASRYFHDRVGVLEPGAVADLIFVEYRPPTPMTAENVADHIVFGFDESMITSTMVGGTLLMRDREMLTLEEEAITARARELVPELWRRYERFVPADHVLG